MKISEINIDLVKPKDGLIGFASLVIDESIYLGSIGVMKRLDAESYRLVFPTKKIGNRNFNFFFPINNEAGRLLESAVSEKLIEIINSNEKNNQLL
ncbi:MAG: hypothetical protein WCO33_04960 [bacterium]